MSGHALTDREGKPVHLFVVTVERTYSCDFLVAAPNAEQARKEAQHACDPSDDGDVDTTAMTGRVIKEASQLPTGLRLTDEPDARSPGVPRCTILEILGPQESAEERASRLHNEQMAKLQGVLF